MNSNQCRQLFSLGTRQSLDGHLGVDDVSDATLGGLARFGPDHHVDGAHLGAGPQQLLQEHLEPKHQETSNQVCFIS